MYRKCQLQCSYTDFYRFQQNLSPILYDDNQIVENKHKINPSGNDCSLIHHNKFDHTFSKFLTKVSDIRNKGLDNS